MRVKLIPLWRVAAGPEVIYVAVEGIDKAAERGREHFSSAHFTNLEIDEVKYVGDVLVSR